tara:strand:+ start:40 stop:894 length:855 start_codon:yes stop_codon:yes gene_type:complete
MSGGGGTQTIYQKLDPVQAKFVEYGLDQALSQYQNPDMPSFYPGDTFVGPSEQTQAGLDAAQNRAVTGNPLIPAAQQQVFDTISGEYLTAGNPYFTDVFNTASDAAQQKYFDAMNQINSQASMAGRYGSGAMADLQDRATSQFAKSLTDTAGKLAFDNYATERQNQLAQTQLAPFMAAQDYADIDRLLQLGQVAEGYEGMALEDDINRFNFESNLPAIKLNTFLNAAYGAPSGSVSTVPVPRTNPIAGAFGGGLAGSQLLPKIFTGMSAGTGGALGALAGILSL